MFRLAIGQYWLNILFLGAIIFMHWEYAYRNDLLAPDSPDRETINKAIRRRVIVAQLLYAAAALLCFVNNFLSITATFLIQLNYAIAPRFRRRS